MRSLARPLKRAVLRVLYRTGLLMRLADQRLKRRCVVLAYHRVLPPERLARSYSTPAIALTPDTFERHVRFLRSNFNILGLADFMRCLRGDDPWPTRACLITFDDGWYDNYEFAHPILERLAVQATLFVAGNYIDSTQTFWQEDLSQRLFEAWRRRQMPESLQHHLPRGQALYDFTPAAAKQSLRDVVTALKSDRQKSVPQLLRELKSVHPMNGEREDRFLGWEQLRLMQQAGTFTIGSHAMSHIPLDELPAAEIATELADSRSLLARQLGVAPVAIGYPNGGFNDIVVEQAREAGFQIGFTMKRGPIEAGADPLRLRRININELIAPDEATLLGRIAGLI